MKIVKPTQLGIAEAIKTLNNGGVIICPTDTIYGFLALAANKKAVEKIYKIKKRPRSKPLAIFVKDIKMAKELAEIDERQEKILKKYWPGKFTFVLKRKVSCYVGHNTKLYGVDKNTIAIRIPKYKFLNDLLEKINRPLAQTSVNVSGEPVLNKISEIIKIFEKQKVKPDLIIDAGNLPKRRASSIMDLIKGKAKILR